MKQILHPFLPLCLTILLGYTCALCADKDIQNLHRFFWATYKHAANEPNEAQKWYAEIFARNSAPIYIYKGYINLLRDTGKFQQIVTLIPKLEKTSAITDDPVIQIAFIQALEKTGRMDEAIDRLIKANNIHKGHQEIAFFTTHLYIKRKEPKNALIVIDNFLKNCQHKPNNFLFYFLKGQILVTLNQKEQAVEQIKRCLEIHPHFDKGWLFYALLEEQLSKFDEAIKAYVTYLDLVGGNKEIERHLLQIILKQTMHQQKSKNITIHASTLKKALFLFEQKRFHDALEHLQEHLNNKTHNFKQQGHHANLKYQLVGFKKELLIVKQMVQEIDYIDEKNAFSLVFSR